MPALRALALLATLFTAFLLAGCTKKPVGESAGATSAAPSKEPTERTAGKAAGNAPASQAFKGLRDGKYEVALLAGGCFWGMEDILRKVPGVVDTEVGYTGGRSDSPSYKTVHTGETGHAESVRVIFDPQKISYEELLEKWFFRMHDPTTKNRQGNDIGTQYRSAIFVQNDAQRRTAEAVKRRVDASGKWDKPIVTEVVDAGPFTPAESHHQDYLVKNPGGYTCHYLRD